MSSIAQTTQQNTPGVVPFVQYQRAMTRIQHLEREVGELRTELQWRNDLDRVPAAVASQNQKAALSVALKAVQQSEPEADGMVKIESWNLCKKAGMSKETLLGHLDYAANKLGVIRKRSEYVRDPKTFQIIGKNIYIAPTELATQPTRWKVEQERNHGGDRHFCSNPDCRSERLQKRTMRRVIITCMDCGTVQSDETTDDANMLNGLDRQFDATAPTIIESDAPDGQFDATAETEVREGNLPLYNTPLPDRQLAVSVLPTNNPITPPPVFSATRILANWLEKRRGVDRAGNAGRTIYATGSIKAEDKYKSKPTDYSPDMDAYLDGSASHVYGSWLRLADGTTNVLSFDLDDAEQDAAAPDYLAALATAGAAPIYWQRKRQRGHLELYFDRPVHPDTARAWCISICPALAEISEVYPANDKHSNAISWPLYQRIDNRVYASKPSAIVPGRNDVLTADLMDREQLAQLVISATTPASLIEAFHVEAPTPICASANIEDRATSGGGLLESTSHTTTDADLVKLVIADFNDTHSWDEVTYKWGGIVNGRFRNGYRGEETASVVIDQDGRWACDYGDTRNGTYLKKLDKYEVWCLSERINKKLDLDARCREYRRRQRLGQRTVCPDALHVGPAKPIINFREAVPSSTPSYDQMCDYIVAYGAAHAYPCLEFEIDARFVTIEGNEIAWKRFVLMPVATKEQRIAVYQYLQLQDKENGSWHR